MSSASSTLIVLNGLNGNPPDALTPLQSSIQPYALAISVVYWILWIGILYYLLTTYLIVPLWKRWKR